MTGSRCPACGAATPETVPWCSLCYADLRPVPAAAVTAPRHAATTDIAPAAPAEIAAAAVENAAPDPLTAPISTLLEPTADVVGSAAAPAAAEPTDAADAADPTDAAGLPGVVDPLSGATWPCARCGARVPLLLDACNDCGAGFLNGALPPVAMTLPIVGDVARLSKVQRFGFAAGLALAIVVVFLVLATIGAAVL